MIIKKEEPVIIMILMFMNYEPVLSGRRRCLDGFSRNE